MMTKIHIALIDDHPLFRDGVVHTLQLEPDMSIVGQGATADDALRIAGNLIPNIMLMDIDIPGGGLAAAHMIASAYPTIKLVMLTVSEDGDNVAEAIRLGARGYILKGISARDLIQIIRQVAVGEMYISPSLVSGLLMEMHSSPPEAPVITNPLDQLSERERQILQGVSSGLSNKEIAQQLYLSEKTVKFYMTNILQKLNVRNRVEAALLAQRQGNTEV